jgi:hypothetical protein
LIAAVVLEAEHAHAGGVTEEDLPGRRRQAEPAGRDHPDDVPAGEGEHVAADAVYPGDEAVGAGGDDSRRFPVRRAVAVEFPAGPLLEDLAGPFALGSAVVPLQQVLIDFRACREAGQRAGLRGPL